MNKNSSPCIKKCCLNEQDICLGCFRSLVEISTWQNLDDFQRESVLKNAEKRYQLHVLQCNINKPD
jgi:predicted Fe-S protein YdhL (DUF1289 family)